MNDENHWKHVLGLLRVGCDEANYRLLVHIGEVGETTFKDLGVWIGLSKAPMSMRLNRLLELGFIKWEKKHGRGGPGPIVLSGLGKSFLAIVEGIEKEFDEVLKEMMKDEL